MYNSKHFAGVSFSSPTWIQGIGISRDATGEYLDRIGGNYIIENTEVPSPNHTTPDLIGLASVPSYAIKPEPCIIRSHRQCFLLDFASLVPQTTVALTSCRSSRRNADPRGVRRGWPPYWP